MSKKLPGLQRTRRPNAKAAEEAVHEASQAAPEKTPKAPKHSPARPRARPATSSRKTAARKSAEPVGEATANETSSPSIEEVREIPDAAVELIPSDETTPIERTEEAARRDRHAKRIISDHAAWSSAGGLIPVPYVDIAAVSGIQVRMVMKLADVYGVPFSRTLVKAGIASVVGGAAPHAISTGVVGMVFKSAPGIGSIAGMLGMAGLSNLSTRILGQLFARHFAAGGDLHKDGLKTLSQDYKDAIARA